MHSSYLIVLATEYELLTRSGQYQERDAVVKELYYALKSVYRCIEKAWALYGYNTNGTAHAFMLRDEASGEFWQNFTGRGDWAAVNSNLGCLGASQLAEKQCDLSLFTSQDQVIYLLEGLAFIKKYVPATATYNGESILAMTQHLARGIIGDMYAGGWRIYLPGGGDCGGAVSLMNAGRIGFLYGWALDNIGDYIYGERRGDYECGIAPCNTFPYLCADITCPDLAYKWMWEAQIGRLPPSENISIPIPFSSHEIAIADLRNDGIINGHLYDVVGATSNKSDLGFLCSTYRNTEPLIPIAQILLHDRAADVNSNDWNTMRDLIEVELGKAPCHMMCNNYCPTNASENCYGIGNSNTFAFNGKDGWRSGDKWNSLLTSELAGDNPKKLHPGIDYMMTYNMYQLLFAPNMYYGNTQVSPGNVVLGDIGNPIANMITLSTEPISFEGGDIRVINTTLPASGELEIRASSSIRMAKNTVLKASSNALAYIKPFECNPNTGNLNSRPLNSNNNEVAEQPVLQHKDTIAIVSSNQHNANLIVFPNPTNDILTISIQDIEMNALYFDINIYDLYGKQVMQQLGNTNNAQISTASLEAGNYILQVFNSQYSINHKFIKL